MNTTSSLPERISLPNKLSAPMQHRCLLITSAEIVPHKLINIEYSEAELSLVEILQVIELNYMSIKYLHQSNMRVFIGMIEPEQTFFVYEEINI
ncbi:hypothetical protein [Lysinibacillus sphaericus]|uniref:hypothetical protein n=1 Tax=Lysinibacillus sphaericus TaxID=1421 RepID=UPI0004D3CAD5|nr:hypothetical protein [Lysinibacillus sphaericus]KEK10221.1 hypothetical protein EP18_18780 [Lysinibacillus sphaericus]KEK11096.1 hypothetical protein EP18_14070 [Lysinibacillus sphaericus]PIJ95594.1 hypothetical protein CTN02_23070 [Lysinibacillus sphaericus]